MAITSLVGTKTFKHNPSSTGPHEEYLFIYLFIYLFTYLAPHISILSLMAELISTVCGFRGGLLNPLLHRLFLDHDIIFQF